MPRKGMSVVPSFHPKTTPSHSTPTSFSDSTVADIIETAAATITRWNILDPSSPTRFTSLFHVSRPEAYRFVASVSDLQKLMTGLISSGNDFDSLERLARCQNLMQVAMKRLENELFQILSANRAQLDPESVSASSRASTTSSSDLRGGNDDARSESVGEELLASNLSVTETATSDLRAIAECMFACGYGKECVRLYQMTRKSIIDEAIYGSGIEKSSSSKFNKLHWEAIDLEITKWLHAVRFATSSLFAGERLLCDRVFGFSGAAHGSSCFREIAGNGAELLFRFPELVARSKKSSPEKIFRVLDMYVAIGDLLPEIEAIFDEDSVGSRAGASMLRLGDSVRALVTEQERSIERHPPRSPVPATGGVHGLTVRVMSFLILLADYGHVIAEIFPERSSPECHSGDTEPRSPAYTCARISSLVLVLLCKLDELAKQYKHVSLSYLFLANNLCHVVYGARTSGLRFLLGEHWIEQHEAKARQFAGSYERFMWSPVLESLQPGDDPTAPASSPFSRFDSVFKDTRRRQGTWVVAWDPSLREEIAGSIRSNLVPAYRELYERHKKDVIAEYDPEELENALSELFLGEDRTDLSSPVDGQRKLWGRH